MFLSKSKILFVCIASCGAAINAMDSAAEVAKLRNLEDQIVLIGIMQGARFWYTTNLTGNRLLLVSKYSGGLGVSYPKYTGVLEVPLADGERKLIDLSLEKSAECFDKLEKIHNQREHLQAISSLRRKNAS